MLDRVVLACVGLLAPLIRRLGADDAQFRLILANRLTLDGRRQFVQTGEERDARTGKPVRPPNRLTATVIVYAVMGLLITLAFGRAESLFLQMTLIHAFVMLMVTVSLVGDFTSVLFDPTDNMVLLPRPVSGRTLMAARLVHIVSYLGLITLALSAAALIAGAVRIHPLFPLVFAGTLVGTVMLVVCGVCLFYLAAARFMDIERFRDVVLYVQIAMLLMMVAGSQVFVHLSQVRTMLDIPLEDAWWIYLLPPAWMAAPVDLVFAEGGRARAMLSLVAVVAPLAAMILLVRVFAPRFTAMLGSMADAGDARKPDPSRRRTLGSLLARRLTRTGEQRAAFETFWLVCSRDRDFKLRAYPSLTFIVVMLVVVLLRMAREPEPLSESRVYLFFMYAVVAALATLVQQLRFGNRPEASWVLYALPVARPGQIMIGAVWMFLIRFGLFPLMVITVVCLFIWGPSVLLDAALAAAFMVLLGLLAALKLCRCLPFTVRYSAREASGRLGQTLLLQLVLPAIFGGLHYGLTFAVIRMGPGPTAPTVPGALLVIPVVLPVVVLLAFIAARRYARTSWNQLSAVML